MCHNLSECSKSETNHLKVYKKAISSIITFLLLTISAMGQDILPKGAFQEDSVKIGISIPYTLSAKYSKDISVIFPDSLYNFSPFEFEKKEYYTTKSDSLESLDSVVYYLSTFEVDSIQYLSLPIFQINGKDTLRYFAQRDSVFLIELIHQIPDSIQLKENTSYLHVSTEFNYPYLLIGLGILTIIIIALILIFGKKIQKAWKIRKLNRKFKKFVIQFDVAVNAVHSESLVEGIENVVYLWKKYLEKLEKRPYTKMTTKEVNKLYNLEKNEVLQILMDIDKWIYGAMKTENIHFHILKEFAQQRNELKKEEVKNG
ncbi:MAG: hypothetical protein OEW67_00075 [Cyclobacteriaceae bacterium]|nr:hypothetical protein [Cyclobacteriaceae bacterium]